MATEPNDPPKVQASECWAQGEPGAAPTSTERKAPRAEPEEDIEEEEETGDQGTPCENQTPTGAESSGDESQLENQESRTAIPDTFPPSPPLPPPPPPPLSASSSDQCLGTEGCPSPADDCISDTGIISDSAVDLVSPDEEWSQTSQLTEPVHPEVVSESEEMRDETSDDCEFQNETPEVARHSSSDSNNSHDECSPPFADESGEEEQEEKVSMEGGTLDVITSTLPAPPPVEHQGELLHQSRPALAPQRVNQEAAQQVLGSAPLSTVAMEPSNGGGAASQDFGCIEVREGRQSRAGSSTEVEREQTGGQEVQTKRGPERREQHIKGLSRTVRIQEPSMTEKLSPGVYAKNRTHNKMESDLCDDSQSDSGVSEDFSPLSTLEGNYSSGTPASETPIEREIRRAVEREHSLRRSRGFPESQASGEYVEIPLRKSPILTQSLSVKSDKGKDRQLAGKKMQHEIFEEVQREQDLVKLGKVPGIYDKGTVRQLKEKKQLFEAFQQSCDSNSTVSTRSNTPSWSSASSTSSSSSSSSSSLDTSSTSTVRSVGTSSPPKSPIPANAGTGFLGSQMIIRENIPSQKLYRTKPEPEPLTTVDGPPKRSSPGAGGGHGGSSRRSPQQIEEEIEPNNNPFFKLRSSTTVIKVEQDIREAQEREKDLRKQRISLYGDRRGAKGGEGGGEGKIPKEPPSPQNGLNQPMPTWTTGPSTVQRSPPGKLSTWPPAQAGEERTTQHEVVLSPRGPRQKTPLVQRWESGLINEQNQGDD